LIQRMEDQVDAVQGSITPETKLLLKALLEQMDI
jgi:hypothetical protein